jgi:hypothetical protein
MLNAVCGNFRLLRHKKSGGCATALQKAGQWPAYAALARTAGASRPYRGQKKQPAFSSPNRREAQGRFVTPIK